ARVGTVGAAAVDGVRPVHVGMHGGERPVDIGCIERLVGALEQTPRSRHAPSTTSRRARCRQAELRETGARRYLRRGPPVPDEIATPAFVLRARPYGESDPIVTLITEQQGKVTGIAKGAQNSQRPCAGTLD